MAGKRSPVNSALHQLPIFIRAGSKKISRRFESRLAGIDGNRREKRLPHYKALENDVNTWFEK